MKYSSGCNFHHQFGVFTLQVILDENSFTDLTERSKYLLHGDGRSFWFDKSFCLMVFSDGRCGINAEHSWADAPVIGHMLEYALTYE